MNTARLTEKITIQRLVVSATTYGAPIDVWQDYKTLYVTIGSQKGSTTSDAPGNVYHDGITIYSRFIQLDATKSFRIRYNDKYYSITNWSKVNRYEMVIDAKAVV